MKLSTGRGTGTTFSSYWQSRATRSRLRRAINTRQSADPARFICPRSLGTRYTEEASKQRILDRYTYGGKPPVPSSKKKIIHCRYRGNLKKRCKYKGFLTLYFRYVYLLRGSRVGRQPRRVSRLLMDDVIRLNKVVTQHKAVAKYKIETSDDMIDRCTEIKVQIQQL